MKKGYGILANDRFAEPHESKETYTMDPRKESSGPGGSPTNGSHSFLDCLSAGRRFARQCESEGISSKAFRKS